jgi:hypothetical protein
MSAIYAVLGAPRRSLSGACRQRPKNGDSDGQYPLPTVGGLLVVDRRTLLNIWATVPDSRNRDGPEKRLDSLASVYCRLDIP